MNKTLRIIERGIWYDVLPPVIEVDDYEVCISIFNMDNLTKTKLDMGYGDCIDFVYRKQIINNVIIGWRLMYAQTSTQKI